MTHQAEESRVPRRPPEHPVVDIPTTDASEITQVSLWKQFRQLLRQIRQQGLRVTIIEAQDQYRRIITGAPTEHLSQITPNIILGGQHLRRGLPLLADRGVTAIVNMRREFDDRKKGIATDRYLYLPTMDNTPPTLEHLQQGVEFMREEIERGGTVYVHCWEGVGRAPTMVAAYLVSTGMTPETAWETIRKTRPFIRPTPFQQLQIQRFAERHARAPFADAVRSNKQD